MESSRTSPAVTLRIMNPVEFAAFDELSHRDYIADLVRASGMTLEEARKKAKRDFAAVIARGPDSEKHKVFVVEASNADDSAGDDHLVSVGALWLGSTNAWQSAFIYDIRISDEFQGRGYGRATLMEAERVAASLGAGSLALHVFGDNTRARKLYLASGFEETNVNMRKRLTPTPDP